MDGYAAYRKAQQAAQASQPSCCQQCQQPLPVQTGRGAKRLYCNAFCKNKAFEQTRQPRLKRLRADYHRNYQRIRRAEAQKQKEATMYQLLNTMAGGDAQNQLVSQHRTLVAAIKANQKLQRQVKKANGQSSYLPTRYLCNWEPVGCEEYEAALDAAQ